MTSNSYIREQARKDWLSIGVVHQSEKRFGCGHKGVLGTRRQELCASCALEKRREMERKLG